jgi:hypothetical protein
VTAWLLTIHSLVRWLILAAGAMAIVRAAWGWIGTLDFVRPDNVLGAVFTGLLDLNVLLGIILLIDRWGTLDRQAELHPLIMILAAVVAHGARMLGRERDDRSRHLLQGGGFLLSFVLILIGIQFVT